MEKIKKKKQEILKQERILSKFRMLSQWIQSHSQKNFM